MKIEIDPDQLKDNLIGATPLFAVIGLGAWTVPWLGIPLLVFALIGVFAVTARRL